MPHAFDLGGSNTWRVGHAWSWRPKMVGSFVNNCDIYILCVIQQNRTDPLYVIVVAPILACPGPAKLVPVGSY